MRSIARWAFMPLTILLLAACGDKGADLKPTNETLAATVRTEAAYGTLARVMANAGLEEALDGVGPYTLLAPPEAALNAEGANFSDPAMKAESAALLQAHIVPGTITRADIAAAIDQAGEGGAQMRTMSGGLITFTRDGETIVATAPDGASVRLTGDEALVSNGALQPTDGLLMRPRAAVG